MDKAILYDYAIVGAGLAGSELCWQLCKAGKKVVLFEMRPGSRSVAHRTDLFAELVCSNSFRSQNPANAVGLLKEEMVALGSLVMEAGKKAQVPAGDAFAVDRERFAAEITERLRQLPSLEIRSEEVISFAPFDEGIIVITATGHYRARRAVCATGPLTSQPLSAFLRDVVRQEALYFYDSIAPIIAADSIDMQKSYRASRYDKGTTEAEQRAYINCPLTRDEYERFIGALVTAEKAPVHEVDRPIFFEACLPIEVMAERGRETLRFGPMKPVGLINPHTGEIPYAVVQLRMENTAATCYNMVGFQTRLKQGEQRRVFSAIPGLESAEFLRYGAMHRNTYLHSPTVLTDRLEAIALPRLHFAGQMTGCEGYVESAAIGLLLGTLLPQWDHGAAAVMPPSTTALGALYRHLRNRDADTYQPSNVHFGLFDPLSEGVKKRDRKEALVVRARRDFSSWHHPCPQ